jgi:hypothetical protein
MYSKEEEYNMDEEDEDEEDGFEEDEDEEDEEEEGLAKDKIIWLYLQLPDKESTDNFFVHLEVSIYTWIGSVAQAPTGLGARED